MTTRTVYVVFKKYQYPYSDEPTVYTDIVKVFSSSEKAKDFIKNHDPQDDAGELFVYYECEAVEMDDE